MRKRGVLLTSLLVVGCVSAWFVLAAASPDRAADQEKIASLVNDMNRMGEKGLSDLKPIDVRPYELPEPGVDVMRARLHETYSVDGIGTDTVELTGWIAVRHSKPYMMQGATDLNWNTAVLDTEFVAMDLHGTSEKFGPVNVKLDKERPSYGQVGRIQIPELAKVALLAKLQKNDAAPKGKAPAKPAGKTPNKATVKQPVDTSDADAAAAMQCSAPVNVAVTMPDLKLNMKTEHKVFWYSLVDTIPPVGHTASITIEPVRMISNGRAVGTLESGVVDFREIVRHVPLSDGNYMMAANQK